VLVNTIKLYFIYCFLNFWCNF